jgi:hypothetical protein
VWIEEVYVDSKSDRYLSITYVPISACGRIEDETRGTDKPLAN